MNNKAFWGGWGGACVLLAALVLEAQAGSYDYGTSEAQWAKVVSVQPVREYVTLPGGACNNGGAVTQYPPSSTPQDEHNIIGTALGAIAGGLLGSQLGGGDGQKILTVAGVVAGGYAGNRVQEQMRNRDAYANQAQCAANPQTVERVTGYDVSYVVDGQVRQVRMDHNPGAQLPLQNGQPVLAVTPSNQIPPYSGQQAPQYSTGAATYPSTEPSYNGTYPSTNGYGGLSSQSSGSTGQY